MRLRPNAFAVRLELVVAAAVGIRLFHVLAIAPPSTGVNDALWYRLVAVEIAGGHGFTLPAFSPALHLVATAQHPPLYPLVLAAAEKLGVGSDLGLRTIGTLFGGLTVLGIGLLGRAIGGEALGLAAAAVAALYPLLIAADGALLSETLYGPIAAFALLAGWRLAEAPSVRRAALVGGGVGLATLVRAEALLLLPLLGIPLAWRGGSAGRLARLGAVVLCTVVVVSPWVIRNWSAFGTPLLSTDDGHTLALTNCQATYHGPDLGYKATRCLPPASSPDEEKANAQWRRDGLRYARHHAGRVPIVVGVRLLRTWGAYQPFRSASEVGRSAHVQEAGVLFYYLLVALAVPGALALRRRRGTLLVLGAPFAVVAITTALTYGAIRPRYLAELPLCVLAGQGIRVIGRSPPAFVLARSRRQ